MGSAKDSRCFLDNIESVEMFISHIYKLSDHPHPKNFLIDHRLDSENQNRAAVFVCQDNTSEEAQIGIYFEPDLVKTIEHENPSQNLNRRNLDTFLVLVEELSHFHLLCERGQQNQKTSLLELEIQGEIDKFLASIYFLNRSVDAFEIAEVIFETAKIEESSSHELYKNAHFHAACFCYKALREGFGKSIHLHSKPFLDMIRRYYQKPLSEKLALVRERRLFPKSA